MRLIRGGEQNRELSYDDYICNIQENSGSQSGTRATPSSGTWRYFLL